MPPQHTVESLIKDHKPYISRAHGECRELTKGRSLGYPEDARDTALEHLSVALSCYDEMTEQAQAEISDLKTELSVAEAQLVRAMAKIPYSLWVATNDRDELFSWLEEHEIEISFDIDHFSYMTGLAFTNEESMMLVKVKYGEQVLPSDDIKLIC